MFFTAMYRRNAFNCPGREIFTPRVVCIALACAAFLGVSTAALAQQLHQTPGDEKLSIRTRMNPAYDPSGLRVGDFTFSPSITNSLRYTDNVYATDVGKMHDFIYAVRPELNIKSDFVRHEISAGFSAERGLYHDITSENYTDYNASLRGHLDVTGQTSVPIDFSYRRAHTLRGSPDDRVSSSPTVFDFFKAGTGIVHKGQTLVMKVLADAQRYIFQDNSIPGGRIDNSDRDRDELSLYTSVGFSEEGYFSPYIYSNLKGIDYDKSSDRSGINRDSNEYEIGVGTIASISDITRASFNIGYLNRDMSDRNFDDIGALTYGFNVAWEPSPLVMFLLEGNRTTQESILTGASASVTSDIGLTMDYELFPNVFLYPTVGYQERDYEGIDKIVTSYRAGINGTYKMNQNLWLSLSYRFITQEEDGEDTTGEDEYDGNTYGLSLKLQF
ncbi:MAG TPA: outer membrane beta-barrel protein [Micavibrio sp.]|nr:outer membrane beta-barrel protein [Micavibrio sp.]